MTTLSTGCRPVAALTLAELAAAYDCFGHRAYALALHLAGEPAAAAAAVERSFLELGRRGGDDLVSSLGLDARILTLVHRHASQAFAA